MQPDPLLQKLQTMRAESEGGGGGFLSGLFGGKKEQPTLTPTPATSTAEVLDPQVKALTKAIREVESGGDFNAKGASGEWGAYQFTPATWTAYAQEFGINAPFGAATPAQQTELAYRKIKQWKDAGYNPGEIASMWNAGMGKKDAYLQGHSGTNKQGVKYDTKAYAEKVAQAYQRIKQVEEAQAKLAGAETQEVAQEEKGLGRKAAEFLFPVLEEKERTAGQWAGDIGLSALTLVPGAGLVGAGAKALKGASALRGLIPGALKASTMAKGAGAGYGVDVLSGMSEGEDLTDTLTPGLGTITGGVSAPLLGGLARKTGVAQKALDEDALAKAADIVAPGMRKKNITEGLRQGLGGRSGSVVTLGLDEKTKRAAEAIKDLVKSGAIKVGDTVEKKANRVLEEIGNVAGNLRTELRTMDVQPILSPEELGGLIKNTKAKFDESPLLVGDAGKTAQRIFNKFVSFLPKGRDIVADDILTARQKLDKWMRAEGRGSAFDPRTETAISKGLREIRQGANEILAQKAPNVAVKKMLQTQTALYDALDNIIESGWKEVGTTGTQRFMQNHPLLKGAVKGLLPTSALGAIIADKVMGD